jgi:DNA adenine methylase
MPIIVPFLKWAGGKRWLANTALEVFPSDYKRYVEPFLGSGALYFHLKPKCALLADLNPRLIETYKGIRDEWHKVRDALKRHHLKHNRVYYYEERARNHRVLSERAAQFIYLNRTCWNGLYRVNLDGVFNVPIGTKSAVVMDTDDFASVAALLKTARLQCCDFGEVLEDCRQGDLVFVDPPYTVKHNMNGFIKYNEKLFSWNDQVRLRDAVASAGRRGAQVVVTNADHPSVRDLYRGVGRIRNISRPSVLAANAAARASVNELLVTTW